MNFENLIKVFSLATGLNSFLLGIYVIYKNPRKELNNIFGLLCLSIGILTFGDFGEMTMVDPALALIWAKLTLAGAVLLMGVFLHFSMAFPPRSDKLEMMIVLVGLYLPSAAFAFLIPSNLLVSGVRWEAWRYGAEWGSAAIAFGIVFSLYLLASVILIVEKAGSFRPYRYTFAAIVGIIAIGIVTSFVPMLPFEFPMISPVAFGVNLVFESLVLRFGFIVEPKAVPTMKALSSRFSLSQTLCYIVEKDRPEDSLKLFQELVQDGRPGLLISRIEPGDIVVPPHVVWYRLSGLTEKNAINPTDVFSLQYAVMVFVSQKPGAIVFVQGLEYLSTYINFRSILRILHIWSDQIFKNSAILVISVVPDAWDSSQLARLKSELRPIQAQRSEA